MIWLKSVIAAPRRSNKQSLIAASFFAGEIALAAGAVGGVYSLTGAPGVTWAIVSSILVLYPGITQSVSASLLRIAANLLGCAVGFAVGTTLGTYTVDIVVALVITIYIGELLRMDLALRTACVAAVIVMSANDHNLTLSVVERATAVLIGCGVALAVQTVAGWPLRRWLPFVATAETVTTTTTATSTAKRGAETE